LIARRFLALLPVLLLVSFGVFMLIALIPGNAAETLAGGQDATKAQIAQITQQLHLDRPLLVQYWSWLGNAVHLNLGRSLISGIPVTSQIRTRLPITLSLVVASAIVAVAVGVPLGLVAGMRPGSWRDAASRTASSVALAIPGFWLAVLLLSLFAVHWRVFPVNGYVPIQQSFWGWAQHITLAAVALGLAVAATLARQLRAALVDVLQAPYIRTAWGKGAGQRAVLFNHALKNAAIPAVTVFGTQIGYLLGGTVIIEQIFGIPGLGTYMLNGITSHDLPVVQGVALVFVVFQMGMSLLVDISYGALNPKVRVT
jgi:peptide/nickel transport system permease protein